MIVEQRIYRFKPGAVPAFLAQYEQRGLAIQAQILGNLLGYFVTELGPLNETVHLWGYDSLDDRTRRRALLMQDPDWLAFLADILPLLETQECRILTPTAFSPIGGTALRPPS